MAQIEWTDEAIDDLKRNAEFIQRDSLVYAKRFVRSVFSSVEALETFPEMGRVVPEVDNPEIREILMGNYRIIYQWKHEADIIYILTVYHSARILKM